MNSSKYTYFAVFVLLWHHTCITESSENLARGKPTSQSSTYNSNYPSFHAVNGQTGCNQFAHTLVSKYEWWRVDLEDVYEIQKIQIYYRTGFIERLSGYSINISTSLDPLKTWLCFKDPGNVTLTDINPYNICPHLGRYVTFSRQQETGEKAVITLCELEVYGCPQSRYGNGDCNSNCSIGCLNSRCDPDNGHCNCSSGWTARKCDQKIQCDDGKYGENCEKECPSNCFLTQCNIMDRSCSAGCTHQNRIGSRCEECVVGLYGKDCDIACPVNCKHRMCDGTDGTCMFGCKYANMTGNQCNGFLTATTGTDNRTNANIGLIILGIISSINTVFIIIIIIIILTLYYKRRRRKETVYENQKVMGSPQTRTDQIDIYNPEQQQTVHYETLGLSDRGSINTNSADAYTGLNMIEARIHQNDNT